MSLESVWPASIAGGKLDKYFHVCAFFGSKEDEYRVLLPFIREGLEHREKAMHIWDPQQMDDHRERLGRAGIDVAHCERCGQLELHSHRDVYLSDGAFDPQRMLSTVEQAILQGREQGYPRTRIIGHMEWALEGHPGSERLVEYEVLVNEVLARTRQPAVCVYDLGRMSASLMMDIMRAHPLTIVGGVLYDNPFFTPPERYLREVRQRELASATL